MNSYRCGAPLRDLVHPFCERSTGLRFFTFRRCAWRFHCVCDRISRYCRFFCASAQMSASRESVHCANSCKWITTLGLSKMCFRLSKMCLELGAVSSVKIQGSKDVWNALSCRSFSAKEPLNIELYCGIPAKARHAMYLRRPAVSLQCQISVYAIKSVYCIYIYSTYMYIHIYVHKHIVYIYVFIHLYIYICIYMYRYNM